MASNTPNLNLYKKDPVADASDTFNITTMLNENWDKIDTNFATLDTTVTEHLAEKATTTEIGHVMADGTTIMVDVNGKISATAEIVESSSNANGSYIKFADGTLICRYQLDNTTVTTSQITRGSLTLYQWSSDWYFPYAFINSNVSVTLAGKLGDTGGTTEPISNPNVMCRWNTRASISLATFDSTYKTIWGLSAIAIGRWK